MNLTMGLALCVFVLGLVLSVQRLITIIEHWKYGDSYASSATGTWLAVIATVTSSVGLGITSTLLVAGG